MAHYQRNANQNYNEISSHTGQNGHHQKKPTNNNAGEGVEKREPSCTVGRMQIDTATMENSLESP